MAKEISTRTEPLHQAVENLSKQQQPLVQTMHDLPKKLDEIRQSQISPETIKELSSKFEPLTQSIKAMHNGFICQSLFFIEIVHCILQISINKTIKF